MKKIKIIFIFLIIAIITTTVVLIFVFNKKDDSSKPENPTIPAQTSITFSTSQLENNVEYYIDEMDFNDISTALALSLLAGITLLLLILAYYY